jgi:8-oxo-dGTP pyrophosphatase MutT (NUDIX family)
MAGNHPEPGAQLHTGPATVPRPAATVILLRGGGERLEVLLVQRNPSARFMGGAWVFPGGAVNRDEGDGPAAARAAAIRELHEEAGIELAAEHELVPFARWITPAQIKTRFDTWFFLAAAPDGAAPEIDGAEIVASRWASATDALNDARTGQLFLVFPTIKQLEQLSVFNSADELLAHARGSTVEPVEPRVLVTGETARIVLPGEPGYEA